MFQHWLNGAQVGQCSGAPCVWREYLSRLVKEDTPHQIPYIFGYLLTMFLFLFIKVCEGEYTPPVPYIFWILIRFMHCLVTFFFRIDFLRIVFLISLIEVRTEAPQTSRLNPHTMKLMYVPCKMLPKAI